MRTALNLAARVQRDRVLLHPHLLGVGYETRQPVAVSSPHDASQIGADAVAAPDRVATGAQPLVQGLSGLRCKVERQSFGVGARHPRLRPPLRVHAAHRQREAVEVAKHVVPGPRACGAVAQQDLVAVLAQNPAAVAQLVADGVDVLRLAGQEQPAGTGPKRVRILLEPLRRIGLRIDADRIEEDVATHAVAQLLLQLGQPGRRQRTDILAGGEEKADDEDLVLDQIVIELQRLPVLGNDFGAGEVVLAPARRLRPARARQRQRQDGEKRQAEKANAQHCLHPSTNTEGRPAHPSAEAFKGFVHAPDDLGSPSGSISGVVKNTPSGVGLGVGVTATCGEPGTPVSSWIRCSMAKSSCTVLWQWLT